MHSCLLFSFPLHPQPRIHWLLVLPIMSLILFISLSHIHYTSLVCSLSFVPWYSTIPLRSLVITTWVSTFPCGSRSLALGGKKYTLEASPTSPTSHTIKKKWKLQKHNYHRIRATSKKLRVDRIKYNGASDINKYFQLSYTNKKTFITEL
jgi:hypothetical protein